MKKYNNVIQIKQEIDSYETHFTGAPLLIGIDSNAEYLALLGLLKDDFGKQIIRMSDACALEFPPDPAFQVSSISNLAKEKHVIWIGAAQSSLLYGLKPTEGFLISLLGYNFSGPVTVLCPLCGNMLESIGRNYVKLGYNIVVMNSGEKSIPTIHMCKKTFGKVSGKKAHGIKGLLRFLEDGVFQNVIHVETDCDPSFLSNSMYPISEGLTPYQTLCQMDPGIVANTKEENGSTHQWEDLLEKVQVSGNLSALCEDRLCTVQQLRSDFGEYLSLDADTRFLCFISLKVFYSFGNDYLAYCLKTADTPEKLETNIYQSILGIEHTDTRFTSWIHQRRRMLDSLDENNALMKDYCERAAIKRKDILWYLSDKTEEERAALIHALCCNSYTLDELNQILSSVSPQLFAYLQKFTFDEFNTKTMASDAYMRELLTNYFQRYKLQKLTNRNDKDFVELVESEATARSFTKLQARSTIVKKLDKKDTKPYFFDGLGVEFLSFIQSRADEYGMQLETFIGHCNLPSITSKNKEFFNAFPEGSISKEAELDEIKHKGSKYDYQLSPEPLHIFDELAVLDRNLKKMSSALAMGTVQRIIILSDHGASRLAVTYRSENEKIELAEPGKHSGRCAPVPEDPKIPFATYEDGFAVLANYERFKGSRKADVETHGGASLEEVVVPVIILTSKPKDQEIFFVEDTISCGLKEGATIRLYANPPLKQPRMTVGEQSYDGKFDGDKHNVVFTMPDIRRKGSHVADIYDNGKKLATLTFETERQTRTNQLI